MNTRTDQASQAGWVQRLGRCEAGEVSQRAADLALEAQAGRGLQRVVAGPRPDLEHPLAGVRLQRLAQPRAGDQGVGSLDPEALVVWTRRRVVAPPQGDGEAGGPGGEDR